MLKEIKGNVWDMVDYYSIICILTNDSVRELTNEESATYPQIPRYFNPMGAGIAGECKERNPWFPIAVAEGILNNTRDCGIDQGSGALMFRFSTKREIFDKKSDIHLIEQSLKDLCSYLDKNKVYSSYNVYLPRPGCGIGGLDWETEVKPLCEKYLENYPNVYIVSF